MPPSPQGMAWLCQPEKGWDGTGVPKRMYLAPEGLNVALPYVQGSASTHIRRMLESCSMQSSTNVLHGIGPKAIIAKAEGTVTCKRVVC